MLFHFREVVRSFCESCQDLLIRDDSGAHEAVSVRRTLLNQSASALISSITDQPLDSFIICTTFIPFLFQILIQRDYCPQRNDLQLPLEIQSMNQSLARLSTRFNRSSSSRIIRLPQCEHLRAFLFLPSIITSSTFAIKYLLKT
jgi:hypothetical protein